MAVLTKPPVTSSAFGDLGPQPPAGTYVATCIDIVDQYGVQRRKFQSEEMEQIDVTQFLFGLRDDAGNAFKFAPREMKISGHEKAGLYKFLMTWLGKPPAYGWDYCEMKGKKALITLGEKPKADGSGSFLTLISICPVPSGMGGTAPAKPPAQRPAPARPVAKVPARPAAPPPPAEEYEQEYDAPVGAPTLDEAGDVPF